MHKVTYIHLIVAPHVIIPELVYTSLGNLKIKKKYYCPVELIQDIEKDVGIWSFLMSPNSIRILVRKSKFMKDNNNNKRNKVLKILESEK